MNVENDSGDEDGEDFETEARALGWQPEEEFQGDKSRFIPAKEFVEKGRHVVPILQQNNKRLQKELLTRDQKIGKLQQDLQNLTNNYEAIEKKISKVDQQAYTRARAELVAELKAARENNDVDSEVAIQDKISLLRNVADDEPTEKKPPSKTDPAPIELDPAIKAWMADNPWFGDQSSAENKKKTKEYLRINEDLTDEGFAGSMDDRLIAVEREYTKRHPTTRRTDKVEGGGRSSSSSSSAAAKTYANLPSDAKAACMEFADSLVGPNKRYKTVADWQKKYAADYFEERQ